MSSSGTIENLFASQSTCCSSIAALISIDGMEVFALRSKFSELRIDYALLNTATPLDYALFSYLSMREQLNRSR